MLIRCQNEWSITNFKGLFEYSFSQQNSQEPSQLDLFWLQLVYMTFPNNVAYLDLIVELELELQLQSGSDSNRFQNEFMLLCIELDVAHFYGTELTIIIN